MDDQRLHQYEILFQKAKADLHLAIRAWELHDAEIDNATLFFHLQQAVEKYLKSLLSFNKYHFEKIHDLSELIKLCTANGVKLPEYVATFIDLNPFSLLGRYDLVPDREIDFKSKSAFVIEFHEWVSLQIGGKKR